MRLEDQIISKLIYDEEFSRKVMPFLKPSYFEEKRDRILIEEIQEFYGKYNKPPTKEILGIEALGRTDLKQAEADAISEQVESIANVDTNSDWLIEQTERMFQKRAVYLAIMDSIAIIGGEDKRRSEDAIPSMLQDALAVTFDMQVGHNYLDDAEERYDFYHSKEEGIPFDVDLFNKITGGVGLRKKTLTAIAARCVHPDTKVKIRFRKK